MGFVDNLKGMFLSVDDEYDDMVDYPQDARAQVQQPPAQKPTANQYFEEEVVPPISNSQTIQQHKSTSSKVMAMQHSNSASQAAKMVLIKPTQFNEATKIADEIKAHRTVFVNLEDASFEVSKSILEFLGGVAYACDGKVDKVGKLSYLFAPHDAELLGEYFESNKMGELETPGIYY